MSNKKLTPKEEAELAKIKSPGPSNYAKMQKKIHDKNNKGKK